MGSGAVSRMLSTHLYYRRSFPFYTFNIVGGLDEEGVSVSAGVFFFFVGVLHLERSQIFGVARTGGLHSHYFGVGIVPAL